MRNETVSVPWLCLSVTSQETRFNRASPGPSREGEGKKCLLASHDCQTWCSGGTAAVGEAGVGSHSCAQVLILWFVSLVAAFPGCSLWGVLRNALWGPAQGVGGLWGAWPCWWPDFSCYGRDIYLSLFCCLHAKAAPQAEPLPPICLQRLKWRDRVSQPEMCGFSRRSQRSRLPRSLWPWSMLLPILSSLCSNLCCPSAHQTLELVAEPECWCHQTDTADDSLSADPVRWS